MTGFKFSKADVMERKAKDILLQALLSTDYEEIRDLKIAIKNAYKNL